MYKIFFSKSIVFLSLSLQDKSAIDSKKKELTRLERDLASLGERSESQTHFYRRFFLSFLLRTKCAIDSKKKDLTK